MARVITIFSTKGGVGKTLVASNLAVSLAQDEKKRVALVDFDLQVVGDMARMLDLHPQKAIVDLFNLLKKKSQEIKLNDFLIHSTALGVDFFPAVLKPQAIPHVDPEKIKDFMVLLDKNYDYIVIDAGKSFSEPFINILNHSHLILLVVTPDILSIYQTKWALDTLQFLHFPLTMTRIILNRAESMSGISWQEVKVSLPVDIIARIPSDGKAAVQAINRGVPIVIDSPRSRLAQAIKACVHELVTQNKLFFEHTGLGDLGMKQEMALEKSGDFWQKQGMTEPLAEPSAISEEADEILLLKRKIHARLIDELNLKRMDSKFFSDAKKTQELKLKAEMMVSNFLAEESGSLISSSEVRRKLVKEIIDEALGLGPLEDLLAEPTITDIMVNNKDEIYIERFGKLELTSKKFISNEQVKTIIERIIAPIGRRIDESVPMVDARLADGSRVNAIIPPLSLTGPALTIRKFRKERFTIDELVGLKALDQAMADFIRVSVIARKNIIVSGGTGSGKTTVLNILSAFIPDNERIVTIEDAAELKLHQEHWIRLESRPPNIEGRGAITIRDLFRNTLRMRPDRIIIGECRGVETLDMLQAMNTGHDGSMTTVHANSTHDALVRFDSMILMSGIELPIRAIREMIASAVDMIVHTARLSDGTRKIIQISEISGMQEDEMHIGLRDVFVFRQSGIDAQGNAVGNFVPTGYVPSFIDEVNMKGFTISKDIFKAPPGSPQAEPK